jgi:hypothetical protein
MEFEPMIPAFERAKTLHASGRAATGLNGILVFSYLSDDLILVHIRSN